VEIGFIRSCLFILGLAQNMTGIGTAWFGFAMFYGVGIVLIVKLLNYPRVAAILPWQFQNAHYRNGGFVAQQCRLWMPT
jgi:hypothetical protein